MGSATLTSFAGGTWLSFYVQGHEQLTLTSLNYCGGACNAVFSSILFDTPATFTGTDATTQGT